MLQIPATAFQASWAVNGLEYTEHPATSALARNANSRLRSKYTTSSLSETYSSNSSSGSTRAPSRPAGPSNARGRADVIPDSDKRSRTASIELATSGSVEDRPAASSSREPCADGAISAASARKYAAAIPLIEGKLSAPDERRLLAIARNARASPADTYPCCVRRCSRWIDTS